MVELRWQPPDRADEMELYQVLRLRDGKVVDMQDFDHRGAAMAAMARTP